MNSLWGLSKSINKNCSCTNWRVKVKISVFSEYKVKTFNSCAFGWIFQQWVNADVVVLFVFTT
jgi:hypothetical protein